MKIVEVKVSDLIFAEYNPRQLTEQQGQDLKDSVQRFGFVDPIIVNSNKDRMNIIIGGHQRCRMAQILDIEKIPVHYINLNPDKEKELNIRLNKNTGEWDLDQLANHFDNEDLLEWGFSEDELQFFTADEFIDGVTDEDEIPEVEEATTKPGDLWLLGEHRVLCGDATISTDVEKLMGGEKADICFTSPPYNSGNADFTYDYKSKKAGGFYAKDKDDKTEDEYISFCHSVLLCIYAVIKERHSIFWNVMYNANSRDTYGKVIFSENNPFKLRETIVWNKIGGFPVAGDNILSRNSEFIFLMSNSEKYLSNQTLTKCIYWNRWDISNANSQDSENKHKACFPEALPEKAVLDFTKKGMSVIDPFLGSGTTLIACEKTNRKCYGMELDTHYTDVIVKRWEDFTGNKATLSK